MVKISDKLRRKGQQAQELLNNEGFQFAIEMLQDQYYKKFIQTDITDSEARERLHMSVHALKDIQDKLGSLVSQYEADKKAKELEAKKAK